MYITTQIVQVGKLYSCKARQAAVCLSSSLLLLNKAASRSNKYSVLPCLLPSLFPSSSFFFFCFISEFRVEICRARHVVGTYGKDTWKAFKQMDVLLQWNYGNLEIWRKKKKSSIEVHSFREEKKKSHKGKLFCSPAVNTDSTSSQPHMTLS